LASTLYTAPFVHGLPPRAPFEHRRRLVTSPAAFSSRDSERRTGLSEAVEDPADKHGLGLDNDQPPILDLVAQRRPPAKRFVPWLDAVIGPVAARPFAEGGYLSR